MADLKIRNVDEQTANRLKDLARKKGMSRERYIRLLLDSISVSEDIVAVEKKYESLVTMLMRKLEDTGEIIERNSMVMEDCMELFNKVEGRCE